MATTVGTPRRPTEAATDSYNNATPDSVTFGDTGAGTITVAASLTPAAVTVDSSNNYTLQTNGWGGSGSLTKSGTATLTLTAVNTYSGGATVNGGTLKEDLTGRGGSNQNLGTISTGVNGTVELYNTNTGVDNTTGLLASTTVSGLGTLTKTGARLRGFLEREQHQQLQSRIRGLRRYPGSEQRRAGLGQCDPDRRQQHRG